MQMNNPTKVSFIFFILVKEGVNFLTCLCDPYDKILSLLLCSFLCAYLWISMSFLILFSYCLVCFIVPRKILAAEVVDHSKAFLVLRGHLQLTICMPHIYTISDRFCSNVEHRPLFQLFHFTFNIQFIFLHFEVFNFQVVDHF